MIKDMGNVELFELFETDQKNAMQRVLIVLESRHHLCTCGHLLKESEANRSAIQCTIKKGRPHGHRYGKTTEQRDYHVAHNLGKRCIKRHFQSIHHRFVNDPEFRASQLEHGRDEEVCFKMDELAQKDFSHHMTQAEYFPYRRNWWICFNIPEHLDH